MSNDILLAELKMLSIAEDAVEQMQNELLEKYSWQELVRHRRTLLAIMKYRHVTESTLSEANNAVERYKKDNHLW